MTFPIVLGVTTAASGGSGATANRTHAIPASQAGNLLLLHLGTESQNTHISWPAGWTVLQNVTRGDSGGTSRHYWVYRQANGTEGTSIAFTISAGSSSDRMASICYRIAGHEDPAVQPPQVSGTTQNPQGIQQTSGSPPSLTPTGGEKDYLWFAWIDLCNGGTMNQGTIAAPPNYTNLQTQGAAFQGSSGAPIIASARRERTAASENPGSFTWGTGKVWIAGTLAVHPAPAPPPTAALTGTVTEGIDAGDIRNGGRTIVLTLANGTWVSGGAFDAVRQDIIDGLTALNFQTNGWNDVVQPLIDVSDVVRTSDTQVTITLPPAPSYNPSQSETVRAIIPLTAAGAGWNQAVKPAIPVANVVRTSGSEVTISLPSVAGYAIPDPQEITATIPGAALTPDNPDFSGDPVVTEPTFTVSNLEGDAILADPGFDILALPGAGAAAVAGPVTQQQRLLLL